MYSSNVVYDTDQVSSMYSSKKLRIKYHLRFYVNGVAFEASQLSPRAYHGAEVAVEDGVPAGGVRRRRRPGHRARGSRRLASRHTGTSAKRGAGLQADRAERRLLLSARGRRHGDPASSRAPPHTIPRTDGLRSTSCALVTEMRVASGGFRIDARPRVTSRMRVFQITKGPGLPALSAAP